MCIRDRVSSKFVVLLMINVIFLILGCLMEGNCIIVMMVPLMLNLVNSFGIDLIQFGILTCVNIYIGCITPPVGVSLLVGTKLGGALSLIHIYMPPVLLQRCPSR